MSEPPKDPVSLKVIDKGEQSGDMRGSGEDGQHPYNEKVVRDHCAHFGEADALNTDTRDDLLVAEGEEEFAEDLGLGFTPQLMQDDDAAEDDGYGGRYDERQEDLLAVSVCAYLIF